MSLLQQILSNSKLTESQRSILESFCKNPRSREFLVVAKILMDLSYKQEAFEVLYQGVKRHPDYSAARIMLANSLFESGLFKEAWSNLETSPISLRHNKSAEIMRMQLALILGYIDHFFASASFLKHEGFEDDFLEAAYNKVNSSSFDQGRSWFLEELRAKLGLDIAIDLEIKESSEFPITEDSLSEQEKSELNRRKIESFFVAPLNEVFVKEKYQDVSDANEDQLDTLTYADMMMRQGNYSKAEKLYKQLQYMSPHNDLYKIRINQLQELKNQASNIEIEIENEVRSKLIEVELIDQKILLLDKLLNRLNYDEKVA